MIDQALAWVDRRFAVFPLKPRDKIPLGALVPHGAKDASRDLAVIRDWWRREPQANIGIATGGGHFVVDLDGAEAKGAWINMCGRHGAPERTAHHEEVGVAGAARHDMDRPRIVALNGAVFDDAAE